MAADMIMKHHAGADIEADTLCCSRDSKVIFENLSFKVSAGTMLNIVGPNGSGKSTLLKVLCGLREPDSGKIVCTYPEGQIAYLGHTAAMKKDLTVFENLGFWCTINNVNDIEFLNKVLKQQNLSHLSKKRFQSLSAGQKRRTCLAAFLVQEKPIWLLDEPFTSLDNDGVVHVQNMIINHLNNNGIVIMTSHEQTQLNWSYQHCIELGS